MVHFNHSFSSLEANAEIVNSTPNASIRIPTTKYKLNQTTPTTFSLQYHVRCKNCDNHSMRTSWNQGIQQKCDFCSAILQSDSHFFIYIPLEQQLKHVLCNNFEEICSYEMSVGHDENVISDVHDCIQYKKVSQKYYDSKIISLVACTDSVKLYNSSRKSLWAIHLYLNCLKPVHRYLPDNIVVVAFHVGEHKPNMQDFFFPLMTELERISDNGGIIIEKNSTSLSFMPKITHCCCDLPAKADVQGTVGHAGHYACGFCMHPGLIVKKSEKSKPYVRYINRKKNENPRTHGSMIGTYERLTASSTHIKGIKTISCMVGAEDFDLVNGFAIDYMHCILLGIMKKMLDLWLNSSNNKHPYYISPKCQVALNKRILQLKPTSDISRKPRPIFERADFKANELRSFLLYYLRFSLPDLLRKCYIDHFHLLSSACYLLLKEKISWGEVNLAEERLIRFSNEFEQLYGALNITLNIHLVRHIGSSVRHLGPLWAQSAFGMEANNGIIKQTTSKKFPVHSIAWKYCARVNGPTKTSEDDKTKFKVAEKFSVVFTEDENNAIEAKIGAANELITFKRISISGRNYSSKKSKEINSIDFFVKLLGGKMGCVKFYFVHDCTIYCILDVYKVVEELDHFSIVESTGNNEVFEVCNIKQKLIYLKIGTKEITTSIPNRFEKT